MCPIDYSNMMSNNPMYEFTYGLYDYMCEKLGERFIGYPFITEYGTGIVEGRVDGEKFSIRCWQNFVSYEMGYKYGNKLLDEMENLLLGYIGKAAIYNCIGSSSYEADSSEFQFILKHRIDEPKKNGRTKKK